MVQAQEQNDALNVQSVSLDHNWTKQPLHLKCLKFCIDEETTHKSVLPDFTLNDLRQLWSMWRKVKTSSSSFHQCITFESY